MTAHYANGNIYYHLIKNDEGFAVLVPRKGVA
jgi:hypothetical protein